ncbi:glycosyltransferase family 4 protein [Rhodoferax aquaticus]|uniref:Glycosyltransferase n=1 Tax=Rhodoferax aquaticus TaxID=2527691 RepID=A0A515EPJ5_9BURK|nr:glycosyltransferase family 4 protein [Rhodoferax aquaticus]QDL54550.1 glycosyltransferase [Rhodoferax aquaticus]
MKILFINAFYYPDVGGGAEYTLKTLVEGMQQLGHQTVVAATRPIGNSSLTMINDVKVYRVSLFNIYWHLKFIKRSKVLRLAWAILDIFNPVMAWRFHRILSKEQPDLIVMHNLVGWSASVYAVLLRHKIPSVQVLHDYYNLCPNSMMFSNGSACKSICKTCAVARLPNLFFSKKIHGLVGVSRFVLKSHIDRNYYKNATARIAIHNVNHANSDDLTVKTKEFSNGTLTFGFIGKIIPAKGVAMLLDCFADIDFQSCKLVVAGSGEVDFVEKLKTSAAHNITFIGQVDSSEFYRQIDVLIVPSQWHEPLGNIVHEAFQYGIPVIASDAGGIHEMIMQGESGFVFNQLSVADLKRQMLKFVHSRELLKTMSLHASKAAIPYQDKKAWLGKYHDLFNKIVVDAL